MTPEEKERAGEWADTGESTWNRLRRANRELDTREISWLGVWLMIAVCVIVFLVAWRLFS